MKSAGQIFQKMKQARFRHVKKEVEGLLKQTSKNCTNCALVDYPNHPVGICKLDFQVCDSRLKDRADTCGKFTPAHGKEEVKQSLQDFFNLRSVHEIAVRFPDVAALLWVLDGETPEGEEISPSKSREEYFPGGVLAGTFYGIQIWVNSEQDAQDFRRWVEEQVSLVGKSSLLEERCRNLEGDYRRLNEKHLQDREAQIETQKASQGLLEASEETIRDLRAQTLQLSAKLEELESNSTQALEVKPLPFWKRWLG